MIRAVPRCPRLVSRRPCGRSAATPARFTVLIRVICVHPRLPWPVLTSRTYEHEQDASSMNTNNGLPLVAPRVTPVLDPAFRPAVLAVRAFRELVAVDGRPVCRSRLAARAGRRLGLSLRDARAAGRRIRRPRPTPRFSSGFVKFILWSRGGWRIYVDGPADRWPRGWPRTTATPRPAGSTRTSSASGCSITRSRSCTRATCRPERSMTRPLGRHLERLPHRLRSRRQRSQGRRR